MKNETDQKSVEAKAEQVVLKMTHIHNHTPAREERDSERTTARSLMLQRLTESLEVSVKLAKSSANSGPPTQAEKTVNSTLLAIQRLADSVK